MSTDKEVSTRPKTDIEPVKSGQVQIIGHARDIHMYSLTDREIDQLCSEYASIDFGLFTLCIGLLVAFVIALFTSQMSDRVFATFIALVSVSLLGAVFFGSRAHRRKREAQERAQRIKESREI